MKLDISVTVHIAFDRPLVVNLNVVDDQAALEELERDVQRHTDELQAAQRAAQSPQPTQNQGPS
jgi:hypothetical protein